MLTSLRDSLLNQGFDADAVGLLITGGLLALLFVLAFVADVVAKRFVIRAVIGVARRTATRWDDVVLKHRILHRLAHLAPALVVYHFAPRVLADYPPVSIVARQASLIYMLLVAVLVLDAVLNAVVDILRSSEAARELPVKSSVQVLKLILYGVAGIATLSLILGKSPLLLFSGLGAMTAVLMLVFKDPLLGFVAGLQLSANRMVSRGDWIEMPNYGADGDVLEVALTTVKVQNWDKTITTIPTYALISESFKNWRGMSESGGRRIKRAINIDMQSIRFCDDEMLARFRRIQYVSEYLERKAREIADWNTEHGVDASSPINGRRLTNVGTFRAYLVAYLRHHPMVDDQMTFLVRQLAPTAYGLPIELYVFSRDQEWAKYEDIQSDIFDHVLAVASEFDLRVYQSPSGGDVRDVMGDHRFGSSADHQP